MGAPAVTPLPGPGAFDETGPAALLRPASSRLDPPFGACALPRPLEAVRRLGGRTGSGRLARIAGSLIGRLCRIAGPGPFDISPFPGQRARLYPTGNLSEKRVFASPGRWDGAERAALAAAMARAPAPFRFVDAGANAGLYTLAVRAMGPVEAIAVEPEPAMRARLEANLVASGAGEVLVAPVALSDAEGWAAIAVPEGNRGEAALGERGTRVRTVPLLRLVEAAGWDRVDALKIDIEGHEAVVLSAFLDAAPRRLLPRLVILEAPGGADSPALALLRHEGYVEDGRTRLNAILRLPDAAAKTERTPHQAVRMDGPDGKA